MFKSQGVTMFDLQRRGAQVALGGILSGLALAGPLGPPALAQPVNRPPTAAAQGPGSFADIVERVAPAVVSIDVTRPTPPRPNLRDLFPGFPFPGAPQAPESDGAPSQPEARASGSGFFISASGYIVTNNHVVEEATKITVKLSDGRELAAELVGRDPLTDLAVVKVDGSGFPFVSFETRATPRVGDWVVAVGNPFGLGGTATTGIVSAYGRNIGQAYVDFLQIDAPINRGNSGGPTFDVFGRVIGVNTAIFSPSGGSVGIGFAIPADLADRITRQLMSSGSITRGYLGAQIQNITPDIAASLGISGQTGALVAEVTPGGPADQEGLRSGDVVLRLNGEKLDSATDLTRRVALARPGDQLALSILRGGRAQEIRVRAGTRPTDDPVAGAASESATVLGLDLRALDAAARQRLRLPPGRSGVLIAGVLPGSDAAAKGLRAGDVLEQVGGRPVTDAAEVSAEVARLRAAGRPGVLVRIYRDGRSLFVPLELPDRP